MHLLSPYCGVSNVSHTMALFSHTVLTATPGDGRRHSSSQRALRTLCKTDSRESRVKGINFHLHARLVHLEMKETVVAFGIEAEWKLGMPKGALNWLLLSKAMTPWLRDLPGLLLTFDTEFPHQCLSWCLIGSLERPGISMDSDYTPCLETDSHKKQHCWEPSGLHPDFKWNTDSC